ncbi:hypothetical protein GWI33_002743 [Rhynchophorus ferrugineus]|uniref:FLYWCH-type domain-containing protein n=1 Tax=Rhynchophorus ferrugineus TaxID=354439 RepID=A0A834IM54_RHYFE|nr:hypothetical protein GWI33_002743 [Rhynchophorus ferrugineus]
MNNNYRLLNLVYFDFSTKYPKLIVDQHDFNIERRTKRRTSWACALYYQTKCKYRISTTGNTVEARFISMSARKIRRL